MRKMLAVLLTIAVVVAGVGFYRGWFVLTNDRHVGSNKVDVNLTMDPDKAEKDLQQASPFK